MWATALVLFGLGHAADVAAAERGAFGEWQDGATVIVPRAALTHLVASGPIPFAEDGTTLRQDASGLLGAMGLEAGDRLELGVPAEEAVASWFGAAETTLIVDRNGASLELPIRFEGAPVAPPAVALTSPPTHAKRDPVVEVVRDAAGPQVDRGALVHVVVGAAAVPVRSNGVHVGYHLQGALFDALDLPDPAVSMAGHRLVDDAALFDAIDDWFQESEVAVVGAGGATVTVRLEGSAVPPPAGWTLPVRLDLDERRLRAGIRLDSDGATLPRTALDELLEWRGVRRRGARPEDPPWALDLLRAELTDDLGLPREAVVLQVGDVGLAVRDDVPAARRVLFAGRRVDLLLDDGGAQRHFVLRIHGPRLVPPDGWPDALPPFEPTPMRGVVHDGSRVTASRLAVRRLIGTLPTSRSFEHRVGEFVGVMPDVHPLWPVLGVPSGAPIVTLDGSPARTPQDLEAWVLRLCAVDSTTLAWSVDGVEESIEIALLGVPLRCP